MNPSSFQPRENDADIQLKTPKTWHVYQQREAHNINIYLVRVKIEQEMYFSFSYIFVILNFFGFIFSLLLV